MTAIEHEVVIAGSGPAGMMLAAELALAGVDVAVVERRSEDESLGSRAGGLQSRTIEILDQRGIAERFLSEGQPVQVQRFADTTLDISDFPTRHPYGLALWQSRFEGILADWVAELPVTIYRPAELTGFADDEAGVEIQLADRDSMRAQYLVGCDGGRSVIRKGAGIEFAGWDASTSYLLAEVEMDGEPDFGFQRDDHGIHAIGPLDGGERARLVVEERRPGNSSEPTLGYLSQLLVAARGTDYGLRTASFISRFTDAARQAVSYRSGRVLLAGDAAHVHSPMGGQGLNLGVQDAVNLGWKLARVVNGSSPPSLLDSYEVERHPVGASVLRMTMAQTALSRSDSHTDALRATVAELVILDEPRKRLAGMLSGLDIHYDLGDGHPLLGRRVPDLELATADGPVRVFGLLHEARPVLLNLGEPGTIAAADGIPLVDARYAGAWELPVVGDVAAPTAVLIRPDGHVAWVGEDHSDRGLRDAVRTWL